MVNQGEQVATTITRDYLLAHGFVEGSRDADTFVRRHIMVGKAAHQLGFKVSALYSLPGQPAYSDVRALYMKSIMVIIKSEMRDADDRIVPRSLDNADALCTVTVQLGAHARPHFAPPMSTPRIRVVTVSESIVVRKELAVTFELKVDGKTPVAFPRSQFGISLKGGRLPADCSGKKLVFPPNTAEVITVLPGTTVLMTVRKAGDFEAAGDRIALDSLMAGKYEVGIFIDGTSTRARTLAYEWLGLCESQMVPMSLK